MFQCEEAKQRSVEGKGEKRHQLDPNRLVAVRQHTERMFHNEVNWPTIKKAVDEKRSMKSAQWCETTATLVLSTLMKFERFAITFAWAFCHWGQ